MSPDGIEVIFKPATVDEFDDVSGLNQFIWIWLIQGFSGIVTLNVGPIIFIAI